MGSLLLGALIALVTSYFSAYAARSETALLETRIASIDSIANELYKIHAIREKLQNGSGTDADRLLTNDQIRNLMRKHTLSESVISNSEDTSRKNIKTNVFRMTLKDEYLDNIINFMIDIEKIPNSRIENMSLERDEKNSDKWNASNISIVQLVAE